MRITPRLVVVSMTCTMCVLIIEYMTSLDKQAGWRAHRLRYRHEFRLDYRDGYVDHDLDDYRVGAVNGTYYEAYDVNGAPEDDVGDDDDYWLEQSERLQTSPYIQNENESTQGESLMATADLSKVHYISAYLPYDSILHKYSFSQCAYRNCKFANEMSQADAVLFTGRSVRDYPLYNYTRPAGQRWIFYTYDPAACNFHLYRPDVLRTFNWTFTYQLHSTHPILFGKLRKRKLPKKNYAEIYHGKLNASAWFVSHCSTWSKREIYVDRMSKLTAVHIFGSCGDRKCGPIHYRNNDTQFCLPMLSKSYKFYLAFENAFCKDYVTEKLFKLFQNVDVIPVVRGGFDYKRYLPQGTFVDASDFKSPEELAVYLNKLGNNKEEYIAMLKRKNRWEEMIMTKYEKIHCHACEILNTHAEEVSRILNLQTHFNGKPSYCHEPSDLGEL